MRKNDQDIAEETITPFLKWPGGKRWFVQNYAALLPETYNRYIEPFLGGGSVFFYLQPKKATLGDINPDVIAAYQGLKENWRFIKRSLQHHQRVHSDKHYYEVREQEPEAPLQQAARMIYLNRTCFNGIYRVNLDGEFNVPRGTKDEVLLATDNFEAMATLLKKATLKLADFEDLVDGAKKGDLIFADPPYTVRHNRNGFIKYNESLFSWSDQERLCSALTRAKRRGAKIVCTNANHKSVRNLYNGTGFHLQSISRYSSISASAQRRKQFEELIILSHLPEEE